MTSLGAALERTAERRGAETALICEGVEYSYRLVAARAGTVAGALRQRGVGAGDRVAVSLVNSPELVVSVLGVLRAGAVLVPVNSAATDEEVAYAIGDSGARLAVIEPERAVALHAARVAGALPELTDILTAADTMHGPKGRLADTPPEAPALIVYTSGSSGRPKGAALSHRALLTNLTTVARAWEWSEVDRLLLTLPCFHLHGLGLGILASFLVGSAVVLRPRFVVEEVLGDLERTRATIFFGVPTIYNRLVQLPEATVRGADASGVRLWVSGSAPLGTTTFERFRERFGYALMDRYGMTECGFVLSTARGELRRPGVVGRPLPGIDLRLVDPEAADSGDIVDVPEGTPGEILIDGPNLFLGYWNRPDDTRRAFLGPYLRSGDLAVREADGQFRIVGRRSVDIIKSRGFKVGAIEIEDVLQRHPGIQEVAVVGVPDPDQGERVVAAVTPRPGVSLDAEELRAFARLHLAPQKVPAQIVFLEEIPRIGPGKFKKRQLAERLAALPTGNPPLTSSDQFSMNK